VEVQIWRAHGERTQTHQGTRAGKCPTQEDVCRALLGPPCLQGCRRKKALGPDERRRLVTHMAEEHGVSIRQGCRTAGIADSTYRYERRERNDAPIIDALNKLVEKHPAIGFWQAHHRLRLMGHAWNHKRVYRVYTALGLNIRRRAKKRLPARAKQQLFQPSAPNQVWSLDFMHDSPPHRGGVVEWTHVPDAEHYRRLQPAGAPHRDGHVAAGHARYPRPGAVGGKPRAPTNDPG